MSRNRIKEIARPQFESARKLTAAELNNFVCEARHTVLTPELLEKMRNKNNAAK